MLSIIEKETHTLYQCFSLDVAEALETIFKHEKIDYTKGIGANSTVCFEVTDNSKAHKALQQWKKATAQIFLNI